MQVNFYDNELRRIRLLNEDMELRMEGALRDGEFQVFYQPKYNLHLGKQDGCEALVGGMNGLQDVPKIYTALRERGYSKALLEDIFWNNLYQMI